LFLITGPITAERAALSVAMQQRCRQLYSLQSGGRNYCSYYYTRKSVWLTTLPL